MPLTLKLAHQSPPDDAPQYQVWLWKIDWFRRCWLDKIWTHGEMDTVNPIHPKYNPVTLCVCVPGGGGDPKLHPSLWFCSFNIYNIFFFNEGSTELWKHFTDNRHHHYWKVKPVTRNDVLHAHSKHYLMQNEAFSD